MQMVGCIAVSVDVDVCLGACVSQASDDYGTALLTSHLVMNIIVNVPALYRHLSYRHHLYRHPLECGMVRKCHESCRDVYLNEGTVSAYI